MCRWARFWNPDWAPDNRQGGQKDHSPPSALPASLPAEHPATVVAYGGLAITDRAIADGPHQGQGVLQRLGTGAQGRVVIK
jgi:hypothetical protein